MGVPADKQREIFQAFSQADDSMTRAHGGTGLGLAISSQLVRLFGGELAVDNAIGSGSTFWFAIWLPVGTKATFNTARPLKGAHQPRVIATPSESRWQHDRHTRAIDGRRSCVARSVGTASSRRSRPDR